MKFRTTEKWLRRMLSISGDSEAGAGGTTLEELKKDVETRTVTPSVLTDVPTGLGQIIRFVREQKGWTRADLARSASLDEAEIESIEKNSEFQPSPRAVVYLADALGLSKERLKEAVRFVVPKAESKARPQALKFAAQSRAESAVSEEQYEAIRQLVEILAEKKAEPV
jgi:transcriptional regulator with XRE-family HTH domain